MNAVEIEEAVSKLAECPFDPDEFPFAFLEAFGNKSTTIKRLRTGASNRSDIVEARRGVLQTNNIHLAVAHPGAVTEALGRLKASPATLKAKAKFVLATDGDSRADARLAIYERKDRTIFAGDRIRWTATDHDRGLLNADRATVLAINKTGVAIETATGVRLTLPHGDPMLDRLDLAYAFNAQMAQGMTADRGIVVMESRDTRLLTQQNFLVSLTRVRDSLTLVVNETGNIAAKIARSTGQKVSALETKGKLDAMTDGRRPPPEKSLDLTPEPVKPYEIGI